jgi:hypothetical protein
VFSWIGGSSNSGSSESKDSDENEDQRFSETTSGNVPLMYSISYYFINNMLEIHRRED